MHRHRTAAAVLALALAITTPAVASASERPADGQLWSEVRVAQAYWAARGYRSCEQVTPSIASVPANATWSPEENEAARHAEEWTVIGSCTTALIPSFAARTRSRTDYLALRYECAVVVHGVGHALGLRHEDADRFPVMEQGFWDEAIPGRCRSWARRIVRERAAQVLIT